MTNNNVTGKQILSESLTLAKHLGTYLVCVTTRVVVKVKGMIADNKAKKQKPEADDQKAKSDEARS